MRHASFVQCFRNQDAGKPQNRANQHCKADVDQRLVCKVKLPLPKAPGPQCPLLSESLWSIGRFQVVSVSGSFV